MIRHILLVPKKMAVIVIILSFVLSILFAVFAACLSLISIANRVNLLFLSGMFFMEGF